MREPTKRPRSSGVNESAREVLPPVPEAAAARTLVSSFEAAVDSMDLAELRDPQIQQWLEAVPLWVDWVLAAAESAQTYISVASTPAHRAASAGLFPASPSEARASGGFPTPGVSGFPAASPSLARPTPRVRSVDATTTLMHIAGALATLPWARLARNGARSEAIGTAFEAACVRLLDAPSPLTVVPVVDAALESVLGEELPTVFVSMCALGLLADADVEHRVKNGEAAVEDVAAAVVPQRFHVGDIERAARIVNAAAARHPERITQVLQRTVAARFPPPRWPVLGHFEAFVDLVMMLAGIPAPPRGFGSSSTAGAALVRSPPPAPAKEHRNGKAHEEESPGRANGKGKRQGSVSQPASPAPVPSQPYPVADHRSLLIDLVLTKLVAADTALSTDAKDAPALGRLRRVVGRTAALLRRRLASEEGDEALLQALTAFHQQSIMGVADTKAVHMLAPLAISACEPHQIAAFLHACFSHAEKIPAFNVATRVTAVAHAGALLGMFAGAFVKPGEEGADAQLSGLVRRIAKSLQKCLTSKAHIAGSERYVDALFAVLSAVAEQFKCSAGGRGDVPEESLAALKARANAREAKVVRDASKRVSRLYDAAMSALNAYGGKVTQQLRRYRSAETQIHFE